MRALGLGSVCFFHSSAWRILHIVDLIAVHDAGASPSIEDMMKGVPPNVTVQPMSEPGGELGSLFFSSTHSSLSRCNREKKVQILR
jgi:hypothetical protein